MAFDAADAHRAAHRPANWIPAPKMAACCSGRCAPSRLFGAPSPPRWGCVGVPSAVRPPHPPRSLQGRPASLRSAAPLLDAGVGGSSVACGHPPQSLSRFLPLLSAVLGRHRGCIPSASPARRPVAARPRRAPLRGRLQCPRAGKRRPRRGVRPSGRVGASSAIGRVRGLRRARPARAGHRASAPGAGSRPHGPSPKGRAPAPGAMLKLPSW